MVHQGPRAPVSAGVGDLPARPAPCRSPAGAALAGALIARRERAGGERAAGRDRGSDRAEPHQDRARRRPRLRRAPQCAPAAPSRDRIGRIDDQAYRSGPRPLEHLDLRAEVAPLRDRAQVRMVGVVDGRDQQALGAEQHGIHRHPQRSASRRGRSKCTSAYEPGSSSPRGCRSAAPPAACARLASSARAVETTAAVVAPARVVGEHQARGQSRCTICRRTLCGTET